MQIAVVPEKGVRLYEISTEELSALRKVLEWGNYQDNEALEQRLFSETPYEKKERAVNWKKLVWPELEERFLGFGEKVREGFLELKEESEIWITLENVEAWFSMLNQARLAMHLEYDFPEDLSLQEVDIKNQDQSFLESYMVYQFYSWLQEHLVKIMEEGLG